MRLFSALGLLAAGASLGASSARPDFATQDRSRSVEATAPAAEAAAAAIGASTAAHANFSSPVLLGEAKSCCDGNSTGFIHGSRFWFPGISLSMGLPGVVAQHVTLSDDGGPSCNSAQGHPQMCNEIMATRDGGRTYSVVKRLPHGHAGNFNGYGDLGTPVPVPQPAGRATTITACNGLRFCAGGSIPQPFHLLTWEYSKPRGLHVVGNTSVRFGGTPAALNSARGLSGPSQTIIRLGDGALLSAFYGFPTDAPRRCGSDGKHACSTAAFYRRADGSQPRHHHPNPGPSA